jgi:hypothetical protein
MQVREDREAGDVDGNVARRAERAAGECEPDAAGEVYVLTSITTGPNGSLDTIYKIVAQ